MTPHLLSVDNLKKYYPLKSGVFAAAAPVRAVDGVSFQIDRGETLSLVGESGCGKTTVGRAILGLLDSTGGQIRLDGVNVESLARRDFRRRVQMVFQDPFSSLNPVMKVRDILAEPIRNFRLANSSGDLDRQVEALLDKVRLPRHAAHRYPHEFSGGQRQRIGIARALATRPDLIVCDEAVSALDVSVKAQVVNLLQDIQQEMGLAILFISHDLGIVEHMSHRVAVMYLGKIVEISTKGEVFKNPQHPYSKILVSSTPSRTPNAKGKRAILRGEVPSATKPPTGCRFHTRCPVAFERCSLEEPTLQRHNLSQVACHLAQTDIHTAVQWPPRYSSSTAELNSL